MDVQRENSNFRHITPNYIYNWNKCRFLILDQDNMDPNTRNQYCVHKRIEIDFLKIFAFAGETILELEQMHAFNS